MPISARRRAADHGRRTDLSVDDLESPEWNIAAVGPTKQALADELIRKLHALCAGRAIALRAGQMVPGRKSAALGLRLYWRKDGVPIWKNAGLIANIENPRKAGIADAQKLMEGIARRRAGCRLCDAGLKIPYTGCRRKRHFRSTSIPATPNSPTRKSARAWRGVFDEGLNKPKGFVLPIQHADADAQGSKQDWMSSAGGSGAPICF